jgi:hypothetical protein
MLENSLTAQFAWVLMYKNNGPAICWASDSGKAVSECDCAQCLEASQVLPWLLKVTELEDQLVKCQQIKDDNEGMAETWMKSFDRVERKLAEARGYIERGIENGDITKDELGEPFWTDLFDLLGVDAKTEVEVYIDIRVLATVTKPLNTELVSYDFDLDSLEISANEDGYEIEVTESEITDVTEA